MNSLFTPSQRMKSFLWIRLIFVGVLDLGGYSVKLKLLNKKLTLDEGEGNSHTKLSEISLI